MCELCLRERERIGVLGPVDCCRSLGPKTNNSSKQKKGKTKQNSKTSGGPAPTIKTTKKPKQTQKTDEKPKTHKKKRKKQTTKHVTIKVAKLRTKPGCGTVSCV